MTWADHALAALLVLVSPLATLRATARLARRLEAGDARARLRFYAASLAEYWALALGLLLLWRWTGRPAGALGAAMPAGRDAWVTAGLCAAAALLLGAQARAVAASEAARASVRAQVARSPGALLVVPATPAELRRFAAVGVTAGVCEELLFRGFLPWYLAALLPWGWAMAGAVAAFGIGHAYQGPRGVVATGLAGAAALGVLLWTGSLLAPVVLHAAVDVANGYMAYRARQAG